MNKQKFPQAFLFVALALVLFAFNVSSALAYDPPLPGGLPWLVSTPWPTANPLSIGKPWSPSQPGGSSAVSPIGLPPTPVPPPPPPPIISKPLPPPPVPTDAAAVKPLPSVVAPPVPFIVPVVPTPVPTSVPVAVSTQGGDSSFNPLNADDAWRVLDGGATVWVRIGVGGQHIDSWLDVNQANAIVMSVYAAGELNTPIGHGTPLKGNNYRLTWAGGNWRSQGDWLAKLTNTSPVSTQYKIGTAKKDITNKSCDSYWEYIGADFVYWSACN